MDLPLLHRLSLAVKFLTTGVIAPVMLGIPSSLYFQHNLADIAEAQREGYGSPPLVALNKAIQLVQTHRDLSADMLSGNETVDIALRQR